MPIDLDDILKSVAALKAEEERWERDGTFSASKTTGQSIHWKGSPDVFVEDQCTTESDWMAGPDRESLHVWLHVDDKGVPFYAGRGRGKTAWNRNGGIAWDAYVRECLGGAYRVVIAARNLTDPESEIMLDDYLRIYSDRLLNQSNMHRAVDYAASERRVALKKEIKPLYDVIRDSKDPVVRLDAARRAQLLQYEAAQARVETGLFGWVVSTLFGSADINSFFITPFVEGLMLEGRVEDAREVLATFCQRAPNDVASARVQRLQKMVDRGSFKKRATKAAPGSDSTDP